MSMQETFSIIVPVYNRESTLQRCLSSVLTQSYNDWELIVVDDGSSDSSLAISDHMASIDSRISVYHCNHCGVSASRNYGMSKARGKWLLFLDSDDWLFPGILSLCSTSISEDTDLICFSAETSLGNTFCKLNDSIITLNNGNVGSILLYSTVWGKLYNTHILREHNIGFNEILDKNEDTLFVWEFIQHTRSIKCIGETGYFYNISDNVTSLHNHNVTPLLIIETGDILRNQYKQLQSIFIIGNKENEIIQDWLDSFVYKAYMSLINNKYSCQYRRETIRKIRTVEKEKKVATIGYVQVLIASLLEKIRCNINNNLWNK